MNRKNEVATAVMPFRADNEATKPAKTSGVIMSGRTARMNLGRMFTLILSVEGAIR